MTKRQNARPSQVAIVLVCLAAWLSISNHCALAAVSAHEIAMSAHCPMHAAGKQTPSKDDGCGDQAPCCKTLRALAAKPAKSFGDFVAGIFKPYNYPIPLMVFPPGPITTNPLPFDTGPPGGSSFAESVLQRSLLAHAPPFLS